MVENFEHSKEMENPKSSNYEAKPYIPQQFNFDEDAMQDKEDADNLLNQLEDIPQLTEEQKKEMYHTCEQDVSTLKDGCEVTEIFLGYLEQLCNTDTKVKIIVKGDDNFDTVKRFTLDDFCNKISNNEIHLNELNLFMVGFKKGEFIPYATDEYGTHYTRKIKEIHFKEKGVKGPEHLSITGLEDIDTSEYTYMTK